MSEQTLEAQLTPLARRGYEGLTLAECERRRTAGTLGRRSVVVTFDDGYLSTLRAAPILERLGFPGTVFAVSRFVESGEPLAWPGIDSWARGPHAGELAPLRWSDLASLQEAGWEVGSHTITHPVLPSLDDAELARQLDDSRTAIAARLGSCETVAYPYGLADDRVAHAARQAGYLAGVTLTAAHRRDEPFLRPRVGLYAADGGLRLRAKLSPTVRVARRTAVAAVAETLRRRARR